MEKNLCFLLEIVIVKYRHKGVLGKGFKMKRVIRFSGDVGWSG